MKLPAAYIFLAHNNKRDKQNTEHSGADKAEVRALHCQSHPPIQLPQRSLGGLRWNAQWLSQRGVHGLRDARGRRPPRGDALGPHCGGEHLPESVRGAVAPNLVHRRQRAELWEHRGDVAGGGGSHRVGQLALRHVQVEERAAAPAGRLTT